MLLTILIHLPFSYLNWNLFIFIAMSNLPGNSIRVTKNTQFKNGVLEVIESIEEENTSVQVSFF